MLNRDVIGKLLLLAVIWIVILLMLLFLGLLFWEMSVIFISLVFAIARNIDRYNTRYSAFYQIRLSTCHYNRLLKKYFSKNLSPAGEFNVIRFLCHSGAS